MPDYRKDLVGGVVPASSEAQYTACTDLIRLLSSRALFDPTREARTGLAMRRSTMERREIAVASRRNDKRIAHAASLIGLAATALERAAGDLSAAHGDDGMSLTDPADVVLEEAVHISKLAADIESHMNAPRPAQRGPRSVTRYTCVMN